MKIKPLVWDRQKYPLVSACLECNTTRTPWGQRLEVRKVRNRFMWFIEIKDFNGRDDREWSECASMEEGERLAGLWYEMMVRSCIDE